jgi:hypothetical protein
MRDQLRRQGVAGLQGSVDLTRQYLTDGIAGDDRAADATLRYGLTEGITNGPLRVCGDALQSEVDGEVGRKPFVALGWSKRPVRLLSATGALLPPTMPTCDQRTSQLEGLLSQMIKSTHESRSAKLPVSAKNPPAAVAASTCISGCEAYEDYDLIAKVNSLPQYPFTMTYYFDQYGSGVGSTNGPGLYVYVANAANISSIRFFDDTSGTPNGTAFAAESYNNQPQIVDFIPIANSNGKTIRLVVQMNSGNTYAYQVVPLQTLP